MSDISTFPPASGPAVITGGTIQGISTPFLIGTNTDSFEVNSLSAIRILRTTTGSSGGGRGIADSTLCLNLGGHNSYDSRPTLGSGTEAFTGHYAGYQARGVINVASITGYWYGFISSPVMQAGVVPRAYGFAAQDSASTGGSVTWQIGYYIGTLAAGSINTALLFEDASARSYFNAPVVMGTNNANTWDTTSKLQVIGQGAFDSVLMNGPIQLKTYTVATVPSASTYARGQIYVSNETGGATPAFSDGTNWRRYADRAIVS